VDGTVSKSTSTDAFQDVRGRLFSLAYRMLGSRAEAEDVVQETYVRWHQTDRDAIRSAEAWLVTTATRLAIDRLRALKTQREAYHGPWLPEPMISEAPPPDHAVDLAADLSIAFLVLLERLSPEERAAFLLHDVFERDYDEIAATLGKKEAAVRQVVHRARDRVRRDHARFEVTEAARARLLRTFVAAVEARDEQTLLGLFAPDATWTADGGGRAPVAGRPVDGSAQIVKLLLGLQKGFARHHATLHLVTVNGQIGVCVRAYGQVRSVFSVETDGERIQAVYAVVNPEKLPASALPS
jgi:RNA polymerase sigma-70 factor (ECF subfamily)